jgi:hypothetical protein
MLGGLVRIAPELSLTVEWFSGGGAFTSRPCDTFDKPCMTRNGVVTAMPPAAKGASTTFLPYSIGVCRVGSRDLPKLRAPMVKFVTGPRGSVAAA